MPLIQRNHFLSSPGPITEKGKSKKQIIPRDQAFLWSSSGPFVIQYHVPGPHGKFQLHCNGLNALITRFKRRLIKFPWIPVVQIFIHWFWIDYNLYVWIYMFLTSNQNAVIFYNSLVLDIKLTHFQKLNLRDIGFFVWKRWQLAPKTWKTPKFWKFLLFSWII